MPGAVFLSTVFTCNLLVHVWWLVWFYIRLFDIIWCSAFFLEESNEHPSKGDFCCRVSKLSHVWNVQSLPFMLLRLWARTPASAVFGGWIAPGLGQLAHSWSATNGSTAGYTQASTAFNLTMAVICNPQQLLRLWLMADWTNNCPIMEWSWMVY